MSCAVEECPVTHENAGHMMLIHVSSGDETVLLYEKNFLHLVRTVFICKERPRKKKKFKEKKMESLDQNWNDVSVP